MRKPFWIMFVIAALVGLGISWSTPHPTIDYRPQEVAGLTSAVDKDTYIKGRPTQDTSPFKTVYTVKFDDKTFNIVEANSDVSVDLTDAALHDRTVIMRGYTGIRGNEFYMLVAEVIPLKDDAALGGRFRSWQKRNTSWQPDKTQHKIP